MKIILGIETSCDDTSICLLRGNPEDLSLRPEILDHRSFHGDELLQVWGGVVPEIAARNHVAKLGPLFKASLHAAQLQPQDIDLISVTSLPGLLGPLLTGLNLAKSLSLLYQLPLLGVNHLHAHLEAIHLTVSVSYPYVGLLVSGGHSLYFLVKSPKDFTILGGTIDDAAGEAFDKGGKLLGLPYPAGHLVDRYSDKGDPLKYEFPIGLKDRSTADLSFSGVKTSLRYFLDQRQITQKDLWSEGHPTELLQDICASYQRAIVEALNLKLDRALQIIGRDSHKLPLVVGGGVACNRSLRKVLSTRKTQVCFVEPKFCTDNGAMIANYALRTFKDQVPFPQCLELDAKARYETTPS